MAQERVFIGFGSGKAREGFEVIFSEAIYLLLSL